MTSVHTVANTPAIQETDLTTFATQEITNTEIFATTWLGTTSFTEIITDSPTTSKKQTITTSPPTTTEETITDFMVTTEEGTEIVTVFDETTVDITPETTVAQTEDVTGELTTLTTEPTTSRQTTPEIIEPRSTVKPTTRNVPVTEGTTILKSETFPTEKPPSQLSAGAIAGIAIGSLLFFVLIIIVLYIMCYKRKSKTYNFDYFDQEFIMEYVNRGANQKYTGYWKEQEIQPQNNKSNQDRDGRSSNNDNKTETTPPIFHINNALSMEEESTHDTYSEGDQDTTREDETTFDNYQMEPIDMAEIKLGGTERFI